MLFRSYCTQVQRCSAICLLAEKRSNTFKYFNVRTNIGDPVSETKQISLAIPLVLFRESKEYSEEYGFKSLQELILALLRKKVMTEKIERYQKAEEQATRTGKRMSQKEAKQFLRRL